MPTITRIAAVAATGVLALAVTSAAAGAGAPGTLDFSAAPNPAVTGETVTLSSIDACPVPADTQFVEILVDGPDGDDILNTDADLAGEWSLDITAGDPATYTITASCVRVAGNDVYEAVALEVTDVPSTTSSTTSTSTTTPESTSTTPTTAAPTTTAAPAGAQPARATTATPTFTG